MNRKLILVWLAVLLPVLPALAQGPSADSINRRLTEGRALEAAIWGMSSRSARSPTSTGPSSWCARSTRTARPPSTAPASS